MLTKLVASSFSPVVGLDPMSVDVVLLSSDEVLFFVHRHKLLGLSRNYFNNLLPVSTPTRPAKHSPEITSVRHPSDVLNLVLHAIYDIPAHAYLPSIECVASAVDALKEYGMQPDRFLSRDTNLCDNILAIAPLHPIEAYSIAAENGLEELAVAVSPYTLHIPLHRIPSTLAARMDSVYLHRLHQLHGTRMEVLKSLFDAKLYPHVPVRHCTPKQRQVVCRAFELAAAQAFYSATPGSVERKLFLT